MQAKGSTDAEELGADGKSGPPTFRGTHHGRVYSSPAAGVGAQSHTEACRKRIEEALRMTAGGSERLLRAQLRRGTTEEQNEGQSAAKSARTEPTVPEGSGSGSGEEDAAMTLPTPTDQGTR
eukprot:6482905-Amphidinium_carterae.4